MVRPNLGLECAVTLDLLEAITGFAAFDADTINVAASTAAPLEGTCVSFEKDDGAAGSTTCGIEKTIAVHPGDPRPTDIISWYIYVSSVADIAYAFIRIGTDSSNYTEYRFVDTSLTAGKWTWCKAKLGEGYVTGTGADFDSPLTYLAIGVELDAEDDELAGILVSKAEMLPIVVVESA